MKLFSLLFFTVVCLGIIIAGNIHYDNKVASSVQPETESDQGQTEQDITDNVEHVSAGEGEGVTGSEESTLPESPAEAASEPFATRMEEALGDGRDLRIVVAGSNAVLAEEEADKGWPQIVEEQLREMYSTSLIEIEVVSFDQKSTFEVIEGDGDEKLAELAPDVLLFEPLILNDNARVSIDDTLFNINRILQTVKSSNDEVAAYIVPTNPIHQAGYYLTQIERLEDFAEEEEWPYIDHWGNWPDVEDDDILTYLQESVPSQDGHEAWAKAVVSELTGR